MIPAGKMRHRVTIQQRAVTQGIYGEQADTWADVATVWAEVMPLTGKNLLAAQQMAPEVSHRITIRYAVAFADPQTVAKYRVSYSGRLFNIHASYSPSEGLALIVILASEGLNLG